MQKYLMPLNCVPGALLPHKDSATKQKKSYPLGSISLMREVVKQVYKYINCTISFHDEGYE